MRRRALPLAAFSVAAVCLALPAAAGAGLRISGVDTSGYPRVAVTVVTSKPTSRPPKLLENGKPVEGFRAENVGANASVALLIDRSQSMRGRSLDDAIAAAQQFLLTKPAGDSVSVIGFGSHADQLTGFGASPIDADQALRVLDVDSKPGTALYDAVALAASSLQYRAGAHVILVLTDGKDVSSLESLDGAIAAAHRARATVYTVGIESAQFTPDALQTISAETGGTYRGGSSRELVNLYRQLAAELSRTWHVSYLTAQRPGDSFDLSAALPGQGAATHVTKLEGASPVSVTSKPALPSSAFTTTGTLVLALGVGLLVMVAIRLVFRKSRAEEMTRRILPHLGQDAKRRQTKEKKGRSSVFRGLFNATEHVLGRTKQWAALGRLLERGDVPLKTVEFVYVIFGSGLALGFLFSLVGLHGIVLVLVFAVGGLIPVGYVWRRARQRLVAFDEQLPDLLMSVAASLKAGHSFKQGIQTIVEEAKDPARKEFQRVLAETSLGRPIDDALADMAHRLGSSNFSFIVTAVTIQNQVGGSLAGLFDMVADTVRQRQSFARKIKALTAMGRASAYVLIALPIFLALLLTMINHKYMAPLFTTSSGQKLCALGLVMMGIGSTILRKIVNFKG